MVSKTSKTAIELVFQQLMLQIKLHISRSPFHRTFTNLICVNQIKITRYTKWVGNFTLESELSKFFRLKIVLTFFPWMAAAQGNQCSISHFLASLGAQEDWYCTHTAHQCCYYLTAVKTGYPLTSITWPYRGLRRRLIEVEYLFEVIRWQVTNFQMIGGSSSIFF